MSGHDALRQLNYLRQCLTEDKRPMGFFLGAGCPLSIRIQKDGQDVPLIPDIAGLTEAVQEAMNADEEFRDPYARAVQQLVDDQVTKVNIETILSHVRSLHAVAGSDTVRGFSSEQLETLDAAICRLIVSVVSAELPDKSTPYHKLAAWIGAIRRDVPVQVFTTNYDLLFEQALENSRVPYFDGFVGSHRAFFDTHAMEEQLPNRWARLWKLHGSINWSRDDQGIVSRREHVGDGEHRVIHPSHLKYQESRRMPYLAMIDRLRAFLKEPSAVLFVSGYSFGDEHLNEVIVEGLQANATAAVIGLLYGELSDYREGIAIAAHPNLSLLASNEAVIGATRKLWVTKSADEVDDEPIGLRWTPDGQDNVTCVFELGNFAQFGGLLAELIGERRSSVPNA